MKDIRSFSAALLAVLMTTQLFTACSKDADKADETTGSQPVETSVTTETSEDAEDNTKEIKLESLDRSAISIFPHKDFGTDKKTDAKTMASTSEQRTVRPEGIKDRSNAIFPFTVTLSIINSYDPDFDTTFSYPEATLSFVNGNGEVICDAQYDFYYPTPFDDIYIVSDKSFMEGIITGNPDKKTDLKYFSVLFPEDQWVRNSDYEHKDCFVAFEYEQDTGKAGVDIINKDMEIVDHLAFEIKAYEPNAVSAMINDHKLVIFDDEGYKLIDGDSGEPVFDEGLMLDDVLSDEVVVLMDHEMKYYLAGTDGKILSGSYDNIIYCYSDFAIFSNDDSPYFFRIFDSKGEEVFQLEDIESADVCDDIILFGVDGSRYLVYDKDFNKLSDKPINGTGVYVESEPGYESRCYMNINGNITDLKTGEVLLEGVNADNICFHAGIFYYDENDRQVFYDTVTSTKYCTDSYGIVIYDPLTNKRYIQFFSENDEDTEMISTYDSLFCVDTGTLVNIDTSDCWVSIKDDMLYLTCDEMDKTFASLYDISDPSDPLLIFDHFTAVGSYPDQEAG